MKSTTKNTLVALLKEAGDVFKPSARRTKIIAALAWSPSVAEEFFRKKETALPEPVYTIDKKGIEETREPLIRLEAKLRGDHPVLRWLRQMRESFLQGLDLLAAVNTPAIYEISTQLYGASATRPFDGVTSNLELARAIASRLAACDFIDIEVTRASRTAERFASELQTLIDKRQLPIKVELSDQIAAKIAAGTNRIRVRTDARFSELELRSLWNHEVESHCLTALNGEAHEHADFLVSGGPRTTMTQEGLAVFFEIYGHTMSQQRFITLCDRVEAVAMAEAGADFMELYRWYKVRAGNDREAFLSAQRIFRGAPLTGGLPFTKDVVYVAGLLGIFNYLRLVVKNQNRVLLESLVCGRMALEDVPTIAWLRTHGILSPPRHVPDWLKNWDGLLSFFSFTGLLGAIDLQPYQNYFTSHHTLQEWDLSM